MRHSLSIFQKHIKIVLYDRPTVATNEYFKSKYVKVGDEPTLIDDNDMSRKVTDKHREQIKNGCSTVGGVKAYGRGDT